MTSDFDRLRRTWSALGEEDPLWAIASEPGTKGGKWELSEFLATGDDVVDRYRRLLREQGAPGVFGDVLDFGCGVGRLSRAWSRHATRVRGVDVSPSMLERGCEINSDTPAVELILNERGDLSLFGDAEVDLVFSHIVLQHMPWNYAAGYLREFVRVCRPGGWIAFQIPSAPPSGQTAARLRRWLVDHLPFGLGPKYRLWRRGTSELFDMHFTPEPKVRDALREAGVTQIHAVPDSSAGEGTRGFVYICRKEEESASSG
jgi:SAM-dependent methyltransferase